MTFSIPSALPYVWHDEGLCAQVGPDLFFQEKGGSAGAKRICANCPVRETCLETALVEEAGKSVDRRTGVRGALSPSQRYRLEKARAKA